MWGKLQEQTCLSPLSAALFSLCPQHTLTAVVVVVDVNEVFILTYHIIHHLFPLFFSPSFQGLSSLLIFHSFFSPEKYLFSSHPQQNSKHSPSPFHVTYHNWDAPLSQGKITFLGSSKVSIFSFLPLMGLFDSSFNLI